jgi:hypothetical protein
MANINSIEKAIDSMFGPPQTRLTKSKSSGKISFPASLNQSKDSDRNREKEKEKEKEKERERAAKQSKTSPLGENLRLLLSNPNLLSQLTSYPISPFPRIILFY